MNILKQSRVSSFIIITLIYIISAISGILIYNFLDFSWWLSLLIADVAATVTTFIFSIIFKNASVYDPYWSVQPPIILGAFAFKYGVTTFGILLIIK